MTTKQPFRDRPITGRMVLFGMLAFFGVIIAVNMLFVYFALNSWPGLSTDQAYEDGLAYNKTLEAAERQSQLGWQSRVVLDGVRQLRVDFRDKSDMPLSGLMASVKLIRPTHEGVDQAIVLNETGPGVYHGSFSALLSGRWKVELRARTDEQTRYFMIHELLVK